MIEPDSRNSGLLPDEKSVQKRKKLIEEYAKTAVRAGRTMNPLVLN